MSMKIAIFEDNAERRQEMSRCLNDRFRHFEIRFFEHPAAMIEFLDGHIQETILISLDHDLELIRHSDGRMIDPGTGREVADYLANKKAVCPVIIHSSNGTEAGGMERMLKEAGWETYRVLPMNDVDWIATEWFRVVRKAIVGTAKPKAARA